jgi:hypothetical protein
VAVLHSGDEEDLLVGGTSVVDVENNGGIIKEVRYRMTLFPVCNPININVSL